MSQDSYDILKRTIAREKAARKEAERILEDKSRELYFISQELKSSNEQLEIAIKQKSSQLDIFFENINDAYLVMDLEGNIIKMNRVAVDFFEYDINKESLDVNMILHPSDFEYAFNAYKTLYKEGKFVNYTSRIITKSKKIKWVHINASIIFDKDGKPSASQGIVRDITQEKEHEELILQSENKLSSLVLNLNNGVVLEDVNRKIAQTNKKFCEFFKIPYDPSEMIGMDCKMASEKNKVLFKHPETFIKRMNEIDEAGIPVYGDQLEMVDGTILERNYYPVKNNNEVTGYLWTFSDITLEKNYQLSLETEKEKFSSIVANMELGLIETDLEDRVLMINQSFTKMSGYTEDDLIGKIASNVFLKEEDKSIIADQIVNRKKGKSGSYEIRIVNKEGEVRYWLVSGAPNYNLQGEVIGFHRHSFRYYRSEIIRAAKAENFKRVRKK